MAKRNENSYRQRGIQETLERKRRNALIAMGLDLTPEERQHWPRAGDRETLKIQMPVITTELQQFALVYNEDRSLNFQIAVTPELERVMKGDMKAFFSCRLYPDPKTRHAYKVEIGSRVIDRKW